MKKYTNFTIKYISALLLLSLLSIFAYINLDTLINQQSKDSQIINLSGKQRMLSQRIYNSVGNSKMENLKISIELMESSHQYLISLPKSKEMVEMFFKKPTQLDKRIKEYLSKAKKIKANIDDENSKYVKEHSDDLLRDFDKLTYLYQLESEKKIKKLKYVEQSILMASFFVLFLIGFFIFRPANRKFEKRAKEINDEKDYSNIIIESNTNAIIAVGKDLKVKTFNKAAETIFGYSKEEMIGKDSLLKIVPTMQHAAHHLGITTHFKTGVFKHGKAVLELEGVRKNGEIFPIRISFGENINAKEQDRMVIANIQDITSEKEKEKLRIANETIYKDLFELNKSIIMLVNPTNGNIVNINKSAIDFYGYDKSKFLTLNISDINTLPMNEIEEVMNLAVKNKKSYFEFIHVLANNEQRHVKVYSTPTMYNNEIVLHVTVNDITEELETKDKLSILEKEFKDFSDYSKEELEKINIFLNEGQKIAHMGSWEFDLIDNNLIWSDQVYKIFDINPEEFDATQESFLSYVHPEDREKVENAYSTSVKEKKQYLIEHRIIKKDGSIRFVLESCIHKYNDKNEVIKSIGTVQDITEKKEKDVLIYQQSKQAAMGEMIENIAHQWKQPLSVIAAASSGVKFKKEMDILQDNDIEVSMEHIDTSVKHLVQTIDDFKNFFKADKMKHEFLINDTFEKTFTLITSQFKTANITIVKNIEEVTLFAFENELIQVLINILNNARDELIKKENVKKLIIIDAFQKENILEIYIKDNAGGIPSEIINEIFDSHFTTKEDSNGTGIGLYMSKMIVDEHMNGNIAVSNVNFTHEEIDYSGAEFKVSLPLSNKE